MVAENPLETVEYAVSPLANLRLNGQVSAEAVLVESAGCSSPGKVRETNEDHFMVCRIRRQMELLASNVSPTEVPHKAEWDGYVFAVADGLGGHTAGERASELALKKAIEIILARTNWTMTINDEAVQDLFEHMRDAVAEIDKYLIKHVEDDPTLKGMATTLTAAYTVGLRAFVVHVGDSRIYRWRDGGLEQMTRDHTVAQGMLDAGQITKEQLRHHARRHVLTNVLSGRPGEVAPDTSTFQLHHGDRLLLCSDGLNDMLPNDDISAVLLQYSDPCDAANALVQEANNRGGRDNVTVIVANFSVPITSAAASATRPLSR